MNDAPERRPLAAIVEDIYNLLAISDGEVDDVVAAELDKLDLERDDKLEAYVHVIKRLEAEDKAFSELATHYLAKRDSRRRQADWLHERMSNACKVLGIEKLKLKTTSLWWMQSTRVELPPGWADKHRQHEAVTADVIYKADKTRLRELLETGADLDGPQLVTTKTLRFS